MGSLRCVDARPKHGDAIPMPIMRDRMSWHLTPKSIRYCRSSEDVAAAEAMSKASNSAIESKSPVETNACIDPVHPETRLLEWIGWSRRYDGVGIRDEIRNAVYIKHGVNLVAGTHHVAPIEKAVACEEGDPRSHPITHIQT